MERRAPVVESVVTGPEHLARIARRPVWTARETALVLRCHPSTVYRELYRGGMRGVRIGNVWRIPADQFGMLTRSLPLEKGDKCGDSGEHPDSQSSCAGRATPPISSSTPALTNPSNSTASSKFTGPAKLAQPELRVSLLGRPRIYIDGVRMEELERSNRRSQIIYLLALHRSGLSVTKLASLLELGGDSCEEESSGAYYVRNLVYAVRKQVSQKAGWDGIIESSARHGPGMHHYKLPDNTVCDLWEFEDKLDEADRLVVVASAAQVRRAQGSWVRSGASGASGTSGASEQDIARAALERAAALREDALQFYRGEFCEGFTTVCLVQEVRMLEERYIHAALQQADHWRAIALEIQASVESSLYASTPATRLSHPDVRAIWREALRNYERVLKVDSYHEEACIGAMECNARLGNGRGVGMVFNRHRDILEADLLQAPGALVLRAYQQCKELVSGEASFN
jgi:excisionase family DNA binding protein